MPDISETTPRETYTIAGESLKIPVPYTEGHVLTAGEASQLSQVFAENIRNNLAGRVKELKEAGNFDVDVFQGTVDDYCASYEMGVRTGGGRTGDPVMAEAMNIARELVRTAIKNQGKFKLSDIPAKRISELAKEAIENGKNPQILETARARVEAAKGIAGLELESLGAEPAAAEGGATEAAPAAKAKTKADA